MVRKLKYHEQKLLKKVDLVQWKKDNNLREATVMRKYHVQNREDYSKYNKICGSIRSLAARIKELAPKSKFRNESTAALLQKLYNLGLL